MGYDPVSFVRFGSLGQIGAVALAALCWAFGIGSGFYITCGGYLLVTALGIGGMSRAESLPTVGPLIFPFLIPGFLPLYYFGTQY